MAGHASHFVSHVEHSTGALGHGLSVGLGMAIGSAARKLENMVYVVLGDGELHEGSNWEALMFAGHRQVSNLCVLIDNNGLSQMGKTDDACSLGSLAEKFRAFDIETYEVLDGHDEEEILKAISIAKCSGRTSAIICNTVKGKGITFMENNNVWHYRSPQDQDYINSLQELDNF